MKSNKILAVVVAASFATAGGAAVAQEISTDLDAGVSADAGASSNSNGANASAMTGVDANLTFGKLISGLQTGFNINFDQYASADDIHIVTLDELRGKGAENAASLDLALEENATVIADLHSDIEANAAIAGVLEAEGYEVSDVIAADAAADGGLLLFVQVS